jgi:hypothetical protein
MYEGNRAATLRRDDFGARIRVPRMGFFQVVDRGIGKPWEWPQILPMWWGYKNAERRLAILHEESCYSHH